MAARDELDGVGRSPVAVYGATGHTGRLVAAELAARGIEPVLVGRDRSALRGLPEAEGGRAPRVAALDDPRALRAALAGSAVVINCAGPFATSAEPLARAALTVGAHYLDHAAEPPAIAHVFDTLQDRARAAGVVLVPGMSFYGATADLLAAVVADGLPTVDGVTVAYGVRGWRMTTASKRTAADLATRERLAYSDGSLRPSTRGPAEVEFEFPAPLGRRQVLRDHPSGELVTIPRHVPTRAMEVLMTSDTFREDGVFTSEHVDAAARAGSEFTVVVRAGSGAGTRTGHLRGRDIYRTGAAISVEAATALLGAAGSAPGGVRAAAEVFPAEKFLTRLRTLGVLTEYVVERRRRPAGGAGDPQRAAPGTGRASSHSL
ncbi:MAG TPA: saccharopine dehydrogenase NADP-binding domain-containing protein [Pseudonocardia sp.]